MAPKPQFRGVDMKAFDAGGRDISAEIFATNGFMKADADYTVKPFEEWCAEDWPSTYQVSKYPNVFAVGIAFAPPHQISKPRKSPNGTLIAPTPPRTGMPSGIMGKLAAMNIKEMITNGAAATIYSASMADMGAACVASAGAGFRDGTAASMTMYPVVPDHARFPNTGRSPDDTFGEIGLGGHWIKLMLHYLFIYKARALPGWSLIPE
jgi:sulfide:quinone oxidoreductase